MLKQSAMEAINFLIGSPLAKDLTKVFQDTINFRDSLVFTKLDDNQVRNLRIKEVSGYVQRKTIPEFRKVIMHHLKLNVKEIIISPVTGVYGYFAVSLAFDDELSAEEILGMQTGQTSAPVDFRTALREMMTMSEQLDVTTGGLKSTTYANGREISCTMYMDVACAFLLHDFIPVGVCPLLTAEELAAIYLHEIGHVLTTVERASHTYQVISRNVDHLTRAVRITDAQTMLKEFKEVQSEFATVMSTDTQSPALAAMNKALTAYTYITDEETSSLPLAVIEFLGRWFGNLMILYSIVYTSFVVRMLVIKWIQSISVEFAQNFHFLHLEDVKFGEVGKRGDLAKTQHNLYQMERVADEFVTRHGLGSAVGSGLSKIHTIMESSLFSDTRSAILRKSSLYASYVKVLTFILSLSGAFGVDPVIYEKETKRYKRLLQNSHAVFKNNLPINVYGHYVGEFDKLQKLVDSREKGIINRAKQIIDFFEEYTNPITLLAMLTTARFTKDMEKQLNKLEGIVNNSLYSISGKFKYLASLKK